MSKKKIWSVPIAALALALMIVGGLLASSVVQAQTVGSSHTFFAKQGDPTVLDGTITVSGLVYGETGDNASNDIVSSAVLSASKPAHAAYFTSTPADGVATSGPAAGTQGVTIGQNDLAASRAPAGKYDLTLTVGVDLDIDNDSDGDGEDSNDKDRTLTTSVTIYVVGPPAEDVQFDFDTKKAYTGARVSAFGMDLKSNPQYIQIAGMGPNSKILGSSEAVEGRSAGALFEQDGVEFFVDPDNYDRIIAKFGSDVSSLKADNDVSFTIDIDTDATKDTPTSAGIDGNWDGNTVTNDDRDLTLTVTYDTDVVGSLAWSTGTDRMPPYSFTMLSNEEAGSIVGQVFVSGGDDDLNGDGTLGDGEFLDGILLDTDGNTQIMFSVRGVKVTATDGGDQALQVVYNGGAISFGTHSYRLSVNGDSGIAHRTISNGSDGTKTLDNLTITVNPVNAGPQRTSASADFTIEEPKDAAEGVILDVGDVVISASEMQGLVTDSDALTYTLEATKAEPDDAQHFSINSSTGQVTVANIGTEAAPEGIKDNKAVNPAADPITYGRPGSGDGGTLEDSSKMYSDITYKFNVNVSDGNAASALDIPVQVEVDVNEPTKLVTDESELPAASGQVSKVTYDEATSTYSVTVTVAQRDLPLTILDMDDLTSDADNNGRTYTGSLDSPHLNVSGTALSLLVMPAGANAVNANGDVVGIKHTITATATDEYNDGTPAVADQTFYIDVTTKQVERPVQSRFVGITVVENSTDCALTVGGGACSLASLFADSAKYSIESGVQTGSTDYSIGASTGVISVDTAPNFEDGNSPAFIVNILDSNDDLLGLVSVRVTVTDVDESPSIAAITGTPYVSENAQLGSAVQTMPTGNLTGSTADPATVISATDPEGSTITYSITDAVKPPFAINASTGALTVSGALDAETTSSHSFTVMAADPAGNSDTIDITVNVNNANEAPRFTSPTGDSAVTTIPEDTGSSTVIFTFTATDEDGDDLVFNLREGQSEDLFEIKNTANTMVNGVEVWSGDLHAKAGVLDYEDASYDSRVHVEVNDPQGQNDTLLLTVNLGNLNDEAPTWDATPKTELTVAENTPRGRVLANYAASDPDNLSAGIAYSLTGANAKSFQISSTGDLATLESIDHDSATPCAGNVCNITVNANDGAQSLATDVRITVVDGEDSVSTLDIRKANPVPGPNAGLADSALSGAKTTMNKNVAERPADLPATLATYDLDNDGTPDNITNAVNFVETQWANWGTVLLIEITSESPDANCGNGNQCVVVALESDSADDKLSVIAYRSAHEEDKFLAAVKLVGRSASSGDGPVDPGYLMPTDHNAPGGIRPRDLGATPGETPVYKHTDGSVARLQVDEEDEVNIAFDNLRDSIDVENDPPEIESFAPPHESAFDDADVDYSFRVTDGLSGIPSAEDLPDNDGDEDYIPVIAIVSQLQCERPEVSVGNGRTIRADVAQCNDKRGIHEYDATKAARSDWGYIAVREDKDFDDIDNGYEVETTLVLDEDKVFYVTFVAVDRAGNMTYFDPDGSDDDVEYAEIVIDVGDPQLYEARTGVTWDEGDEEYDDNRSVIQVIFNDLTPLNPATVETDDFVVEGHTVVAVNVYEQPDDWTDTSRYSSGGELRYRNADGLRLRQSIETSVFLHLQDELQADETPDVTLVPNGIEDVAGNEQDDGEAEADDWISPAFTVVSIVSPRETTENPDKVLAGDDDEVVFNVTVDERLSTARPTVTVSYVDASMVDTKGTSTCDNGDGDSDKHDGKRKRGEITMNTSGETSELCADNNLATDHNLKTTIEKVTNTEWIVTVGEPKGTGYYNFHIAGKDRSAQQNPGSEGVNPDKIVTDFYDADGDVNVDDAVYYEGDINLPKPNVRLGGISITDNEPSVEYRSRLFLEIDFTRRYEDAVACDNMPSLSDTYRLANCMNENSEYSEDSFDDVVITSFVLDGVDITDSVKTTDDQTFLVTLENIGLGDHEVEIQAVDQAGNDLEDTLEIDFEVSDRDPFEKRLSPGWNLISLPGEPADSSIASVIGPNVEVRTVYTYNPVVPGGWQVAVRETLDSEWQGDLTEITGQRGYWVLSDAIQDWEVNIPRLAGGAVGTGTPIQPPVIPLYAGWNLIPVTDVKGNALDHNTPISAAVYLQSLEDGIEAARVLGFDTIRNEWYTVLDGDMMSPGMGTNLLIGSGYWVFVRNATALVPGGVASSASSD